MSHLDHLITGLTKHGAFAANLHLTGHCNMDCVGCFARFGARGQHHVPALRLPITDWHAIIDRLARKTAHIAHRKLTFVGGEPLLIKALPELLDHARQAGFSTCVVTNGALLARRFEAIAAHTDWIGLSVDSAEPETLRRIGRHVRNRTVDYPGLAREIHARGIRLKVNTVVSSANYHEDLNGMITQLAPTRWKVLRWLPIQGENDAFIHMAVSEDQFTDFVARHREHAPVAEDNADMLGSYVMIDPDGWLLDNADGHQRQVEPLLVQDSAPRVAQYGFSAKRFAERGGIYPY